MKQILIISIIGFFLFTSCIRNPDRNSSKKAKTDKYTDISFTPQKNHSKDTIDYNSLEISDDSLDLALFNLILAHKDFSKAKIKDNIKLIIKKGANPNAIIEYNYSSRKLGTYIPIVKAFYKNKYRTSTANSTAFHEAVNSQELDIIKELIKLGADVNTPNKDALFPIDIALKNESEDIIDLLLKNNCVVSNANLSISNNIDLIERFVKLGANPKTIDINFALSDVTTLKRVLELKPQINNAELNYRIIFNDEEILDLLLKNGINNSAKGQFPDTGAPLIYGAIKYADLSTIIKLEEAGINIFQTKKSGTKNESPFISVVKSQKIDIIQYYIEKQANVNAKDWTGKSVLISAIDTDNDEVIKTLISAGANKEYSGYFNKTPLMHAIQFDKYISAEVLINEGANVNFKDKYGKTCLIVAIDERNLPMIKLLINNGVNTNFKYKKMNVVEYAKSINAQTIIIQYLEQNI